MPISSRSREVRGNYLLPGWKFPDSSPEISEMALRSFERYAPKLATMARRRRHANCEVPRTLVPRRCSSPAPGTSSLQIAGISTYFSGGRGVKNGSVRAHHPCGVGVDAGDCVQTVCRPTVLSGPGRATVRGSQDRTGIADDNPAVGVDKTN